MDEAAEVADEVEGFVGPGVPSVGVIGDARWFVVFESEAVDGPVNRGSARHGVVVGLVGDVNQLAAVVDLQH